MKAMTKQELADMAGVTPKTFRAWCKPYEKELRELGMRPHMKALPPQCGPIFVRKVMYLMYHGV